MAQRLERSPLTAVARVRFAGIHFPHVERPLLNSHNRLRKLEGNAARENASSKSRPF